MDEEYTEVQKLGLLYEARKAKDVEGSPILTNWEKEFLASVHQQFLIKDHISPKQAAIVQKIWTKFNLAEPDYFANVEEADAEAESENPAPPLPTPLQRNTRTYKEDDDAPF